jgi:hypothetical protein
MSQETFYIKADVFGKVRYWDFINGLTRAGKLKGFQQYASRKEAFVMIRKLKSIFHNGIKFDIITEDKLPFIAKQIRERNRVEKLGRIRELPKITKRHNLQLAAGKAVRLVKPPKGYLVEILKDGKHYKFVKMK